MKKSLLIYALSLLCVSSIFAQTEATVFTQYKANPKTSVLPDFSYAGYHNGEKAIDYSAKNLPTFNVTNYGAVANDASSDKAAIKLAIDAALASSTGGIVFFPPGRFIIQGLNDDNTGFEVLRKSNIILKGSGSGTGGTELYMEKATFPPDNGPIHASTTMFTIGGVNAGTDPRAATADAVVGDFNVTLANTADLVAGGWLLFEMRTQDAAAYALDLGSYPVNPAWTELTNGVKLSFVLQIKQIVGNTVTLKQPLPYPIKSSLPWNIQKYKYVEEMGVEDIAFVGNFTRPFVHHGSAEDDSGYSMIQMKRTVNSWIRRCRFTNVSVGASFGVNGANITVTDCEITGNGGHEAITNAGSTNVLFTNIQDKTTQGQWHSVGVSNTSMNTVIYNVTYPSTTSFETHSSQPRNTLLDNVTGGLLDGRGGGATENMPNHLRKLVFWNYEKTNSDFSNFRFWPNSTYWKIPYPILVGFHGKPTSFTSSELGYEESRGTPVFPVSLYQAQLQLRLANAVAGHGDWSSPQGSYDYNLGSNTGTGGNFTNGSSETSFGPPATVGFLPTPPSGVVKVQVNGTNTGGDGFSINNPTNPATASINFTANSSSLSKLSGYDIDNSTEIASMFFDIDFNNVATNGSYVWALGNNNAASSLFKTSSSVYKANTELFTSFEWTIKATSIDFKFRESANSANSVKSLIDNTTFTRGGSHKIEVYANNSMALQTYDRVGTTYSIPAGKFHLWVNNAQLTYGGSPNFSKSLNTDSAAPELATNASLNAYLFHANGSTLPTDNAATATISKIKLNYNTSTLAIAIATGKWLDEATANNWSYNFTGGTSGTYNTNNSETLSTDSSPFLPAPSSGVSRLWVPDNSSASFVFDAPNNNIEIRQGTNGVTKFSAYSIANATEIAAQNFTFTFGQTGANVPSNGTTYVYSMGSQRAPSTIYNNKNSVYKVEKSPNNGIGTLFNALTFVYNTTANAYLVNRRTQGTAVNGFYEGLDGGNLSLDKPYKVEVYSNNSPVSKSYKRGSTNYNVVAESFQVWISDVNANTSARYSLLGTTTYDIPKSVETNVTTGDYSIPVNTPLDAFLFNGNSVANGFAKLTVKGGLSMAYNVSTLPVSLISFTGKKETNGIRLNWKTASELNNDYFDLLRSTEGLDFRSITKVAGKGTSNQLNTYSYLDNAPETGTNYYKLKQVDKDGTATVSDIVVAVNNSLSDEQVFTAVFVGESDLKVHFNSVAIDNATIRLHDLSGRLILNKSVNVTNGLNDVALQTPALVKGIYVITLVQDGKSRSVKVAR